jgi:hypothetical protein
MWAIGRRVSKHWKPDGDSARWTRADDYSPPRNASWPEGATAGLVLVAAACLAVGAIFYKLAGPRDVIEENVTIDWDQVPGLPAPDSQH